MTRAVLFDAVGTLIVPDPAPGDVYAAVGARHGSRRDAPACRARFRAAFAKEEAIDAAAGYRTDEARERRRWRAIVAAVLDDAADPEACFCELWDWFARPEAWRVVPAAEAVLRNLTGRGWRVGLASNFDARLHAVAAGLPVARRFNTVIVSSEVGWRKPAAGFFAAAAERVGLPPERLWLVGDDRVNDYQGASAAGWRAVLVGEGVGLAGAVQAIELGSEADSSGSRSGGAAAPAGT